MNVKLKVFSLLFLFKLQHKMDQKKIPVLRGSGLQLGQFPCSTGPKYPVREKSPTLKNQGCDNVLRNRAIAHLTRQ
jgi:hypothetical protein